MPRRRCRDRGPSCGISNRGSDLPDVRRADGTGRDISAAVFSAGRCRDVLLHPFSDRSDGSRTPDANLFLRPFRRVAHSGCKSFSPAVPTGRALRMQIFFSGRSDGSRTPDANLPPAMPPSPSLRRPLARNIGRGAFFWAEKALAAYSSSIFRANPPPGARCTSNGREVSMTVSPRL